MKKVFIFIFHFLVCTSYANKDVQAFFHFMRINDYDKAKSILNKTTDNNLKHQLESFYLIKFQGLENKNLKDKIDAKNYKTISLLNKGLILYYKKGNELESFNTLKKALNLAINSDQKILICEISKAILDIYERFSDNVNDKSFSYFLKIHNNYAYDHLEKEINSFYHFSLNLRYNYKKEEFVVKTFNNFKSNFKKTSSPLINARSEIAEATYNLKISKNFNTGIKHIKEAIKILEKRTGYIEKEKKASAEIVYGALLFLQNKNYKAIDKLKSIAIDNDDFIFKILRKYKSFWLYKSYSNINNRESLLHYNNYLKNDITLNHSKSLATISELGTKYKTEETEEENKELKHQNKISEEKRKQNRNLFFLTLSFLCLGTIIALQTINNSRKKRQLAEQEKELEQKKNDILLKEQELNAINAMVEGQEKERKRIAEDLHDNVGSVLATLKLHFENLKLNREKKQFNQEELYEKTEELIDETYAKIRHIAHEKNAGVIANQGLLVAIKMMASKISAANKTHVEVVDFGLDKRLENSLEIAVFRIIQELTTNILKHAEAQTATINISLYEEELSIIIEDDGKGFDTQKVDYKNGMGLSSIKTRIEHLNGTFDIDSSIGKGTSIIINIPTT